VNNLRLLSCFRVSAKMRQYVLRLRLSDDDFDFGSTDDAANRFIASIDLMRQILARRGISFAAANSAISKTLAVAADHQLSQLRFEHARKIKDESLRSIGKLSSQLRELAKVLSRFPPTSKGELNKRAAAAFSRQPFDTEVFIEVLETVKSTLPELSPKRFADEACLLIDQPLPHFKDVKLFLAKPPRPLIIEHWESIAGETRVAVERLMQELRPPTSLGEWLTSLADLLDQERPVRKRASSVNRQFVTRVKSILASLKFNPARRHDAYAARQDGSDFQRFCNAALAAFGDNRRISGRQISNLQQASAGRRPSR
jgi:hypothetical protein